jgi:uncharacterized coiled-coil protein SlyX
VVDSGGRNTDKNLQSKDDALEALDFIVNVLKEHEKDLDKLINELATVTEQIGDSGELSSKVQKVEEKIDVLQKQVTNLINSLLGAQKEASPAAALQQNDAVPTSALAEVVRSGPSVVLRCSQWEDFQTLATKAQTISFSYKEQEKIFQADALKGNQVITYSGSLPKLSSILKQWLSKQLDIPDRSVLEGVLVVS